MKNNLSRTITIPCGQEDVSVKLTELEQQLIALLIAAQGKILYYEDCCSMLWPSEAAQFEWGFDEAATEKMQNHLKVLLHNCRKKLTHLNMKLNVLSNKAFALFLKLLTPIRR